MGPHSPLAAPPAVNPHTLAAVRPNPATFLVGPGGFWRAATRLTVAALLAMAAAPAVHAAPPRDYAVGVAKLSLLGLPDVRQATYVQLDAGYAATGELAMYGNEPKLAGNAWLLTIKPDGTAVMLLDQVRVIEVLPPALAEARMKARLEAMSRAAAGNGATAESDAAEDVPDPVAGKWKEADLAADIHAVTEYLEKSDARSDYAVERSAGLLFLFAAQVHSRGQSAEANRMMALLFEKVGDSRTVLGAAINRIADAQYQEAYRAFATSGNWTQYLAAMEAQTARFGTVWRQAPVVARAMQAVRAQLASGTPPTLAGDGLTDDDRRIAGLLGRPDAVVSLRHPVFGGGTWVLQEPAASPTSGKPPGPLDLIQQRGTAAIPLLVALLADGRLVRTSGESSQSFPHFSSDDDPMDDEEIERTWANFPRPHSMGEVARRILAPLVLSEEEARGAVGAITPELLAQKSQVWYSQHKSDDRAALRRLFLASGRQEVIWRMIRSSEAADQEAMEAYLLAGKDLLERLSVAVEYVRFRGVAAKAFVGRYVAELNKLPAAGPAASPGPMQRPSPAGKLAAVIKTLEELVSEETGEQQLQELLAVEQPWSEEKLQKVAPSLVTKLARQDPTAVRTALLQACLKTQDTILADFLVRCVGLDRMARLRARSQGGAAATQVEEPTLAAHADLWRQVMARPRSKATGSLFDSASLDFDVLVAYTIEELYGEVESANADPELAQILGDRLYPFMVQRAQARLAGKPAAELPGYPNKAGVGAERRAEITRLLQEATTENQHEVSGRLSLADLLVVPELVAADPKLNEKLVAGSHVIREVRLPEGNVDLARVCLSLKDKMLDRAAFEALVAECRRQEPLGIDISVILERRLPLAGLVLRVGAVAVPQRLSAPADQVAAYPQAVLIAAVQAEGDEAVSGMAQWPLGAAPTPAPAPASAATDDDLLPTSGRSSPFGNHTRDDADFWESFRKLFVATRSPCTPYHCLLLVRRPEQPSPDEAFSDQNFIDE